VKHAIFQFQRELDEDSLRFAPVKVEIPPSNVDNHISNVVVLQDDKLSVVTKQQKNTSWAGKMLRMSKPSRPNPLNVFF
jgi:hypothetical protein